MKTLRYTNPSANAISAIATFGSSVVQTIGERLSSRQILLAGAVLLAAGTALVMPEGLATVAQTALKTAAQATRGVPMTPVLMIGGTALIGAVFGTIGGLVVRQRERRWE